MTPDDQSPLLSTSKAAETLTPETFATAALFWRARYLRDSAFLPHLALLFWLIDILRPRQVVALGLGDGVAYFAACQAMDRLNSAGGCTAITTGGTDIGADITAYNDRNYRDISRLIPAGPGPAVALFADGSVDLLLIDPNEGQDGIPSEWQDKLSARAVIVLCGGGQNGLQDFYADQPRIAFAEGEGLVVILQGRDCDPQLEGFIAAGPFQTAMRAALRRLGDAHQFEWQGLAARDKLSAARSAQATTETRLADLEARHDMLTLAYAERSNVIARQQSDIFDVKAAHEERAELQRKLDTAQAEQDRLRAEVEKTAQDERAELQRRLDTAEAEQDRLKAERDRTAVEQAEQDRLKAELDIRFREIAALTQLLETRARAHAAEIAQVTDALRATEVAPLAERLRAAEAGGEALAERLRAAEAGVTALLDSTSWRVTAPLRQIVLALRRRS